MPFEGFDAESGHPQTGVRDVLASVNHPRVLGIVVGDRFNWPGQLFDPGFFKRGNEMQNHLPFGFGILGPQKHLWRVYTIQ